MTGLQTRTNHVHHVHVRGLDRGAEREWPGYRILSVGAMGVSLVRQLRQGEESY